MHCLKYNTAFCRRLGNEHSITSAILYHGVKPRSSAVAETVRRFVSLNISLSHSSSLKFIRNDTLEYGVCKSLLVFRRNYEQLSVTSFRRLLKHTCSAKHTSAHHEHARDCFQLEWVNINFSI